MPERLHPSPIAVLTRHRPGWSPPAVGVVWCSTTAELAALAREGHLGGAVIEGLIAELDPDLVHLVRAWCPVVVIDDLATERRWAALGAATLPRLPPDLAGLRRLLAATDGAGPSPRCGPSPRPGALVAMLAAPGGNGAATTVALARALVLAAGPARIVLADLTLDAPHRALHGLSADGAGLPELVRSARFGPPPAAAVAGALHRTASGYRVLPGLAQHHDWVCVGRGAAAGVIEALRREADVVVAHIDRDLEGEPDTGSYDIEDRNVLARTAVRSADLVVVSAGGDRSARLGLITVLGNLARHGVSRRRTVVVVPRSVRRRSLGRAGGETGPVLRSGDGRAGRRLGAAILDRIEHPPERDPGSVSDEEPELITPGTLGHWRQDDDGWITPRAPQQP